MKATALTVLLGLVAGCAATQTISNSVVQVQAVGVAGAYTGFTLSTHGEEVATVLLGSNGIITARTARVAGDVLRLSGLAADPTPALGAGSFVEVKLLPDDPYPQVSFRLEIQRFDRAAWEQRLGQVPFHFLICSVPGAKVFHQRGWAIGTPVEDPYIQMQAEGPGRTVVSNWSRNWTYAPPIGAYPTAIAGLWHPDARRYVGYDFHGARLTDHTEKDFGTSYCWECGESREFFCLTWPFAGGYNYLRYPTPPEQCGTHFRLLWSDRMGPADDPNLLVHQFIWRTYAERLPDVEPMNDLSWLPGNLRINGFRAPIPLGGFVHNTGETGETWWAPNVNIVGGVHYFSPVDYYYQTADRTSIRKLETECRRVVELGKWMDVGGDRCFYWQTPLDGGGAPMFGPGVETFHHVSPVGAALAMLDYYRNDPEGARDLLPYINGVLHWVKHTLYTRNCYPDVPAAQFAWSATPIVTFCLKYYFAFRDSADPQQRTLADLAHTLARSMTYRYLALWPCDNDEMDDLDSSFMMEPNAGLPWLGCACANEVWVYNIAMLYEYITFGDPIMGHYLRGMLERYHEMYQDQYYSTISAYPSNAFTERFGLYKECAQGKGVRGDFGGLWGELERLIWPLGSATVRVVCGEKAAMAFNRQGRHTDIADYRYYGDGRFSFKLIPGGLEARPGAEMDLVVTCPFFDLRGKPISLLRGGTRMELGVDRVVDYPAEPSTLTIRGVMLGDTVAVGRYDESLAPLPCTLAKKRTMPSAEGESVIQRDGFDILNLARGAFEGIRRDWDDPASHAGYESGIKTIYGVPFLLLDPDLTGNRVQVPRQGIAFGDNPQYLFLLVGDITDRSRLTLYRGEDNREAVDLNGAIPVLTGWPPLFGWHIDLVLVENAGRPITSIAPAGCKIFAITSTRQRGGAVPSVLAAIRERRQEVLARAELVKAVAELGPLFEPLSGHIALLPSPGASNPRSNPLVKLLREAGLDKHLVFLSREDLVNPTRFNIRNIWVALYVGGEEYYQSIHREGDGDEALVNWLKGGGTLVSLATGPFLFYYNEKGRPVVNASKFGLPISGSGAGDRLDTLDVVSITGWEKPPENLQLSFHLEPDQKMFTSLPATIPWDDKADPRWRPIFNVVGEGNTYLPVVTLRDQAGRKYGEAVADIQYRTGDLAGARVIYLWSSFRSNRDHGRAILIDLLRYVLTTTLRPVGEYTCFRTSKPPVIDGKLDDDIWRQTPATEAFTRFDDNRTDGQTLTTTARLAWDDGNLYVAWECEDPDVWATFAERDRNLWEEEVVEVYLEPEGDGRDYYELELNPLNTVVDLKIPSSVDDVPQDVEGARQWDARELQTAVHVDGTVDNRDDTDRGWTAEMAIPWPNITTTSKLPPHIGDTWRVQLLRIDRSKGLPGPQYSAWSVTNTFHNTARFGRVIFSTNPCDDDFSGYPAGSPPTPAWSITGGEWKVLNEELVGKNSGTGAWTPTGAVAGDGSWTDYRLTLRFQVRSRGSDHRDGAWIGFRYNGPGACYSLNLSGNVATLHKAFLDVLSGDENPLAYATWSGSDGWHDLSITVEGPRISVQLDGQPLMDVVDRDALGVPPVQAGGICLSARRWQNSTGDTVVAFDDVKLYRIP